LFKRLEPRPVALVGGAFRINPLIGESFRQDLQAEVEVINSDVDAAMTAGRLASRVR
jgi:glucosamine kinase